MALRAIRYGSGVWKLHEEQRQRLEARVSELETQLTLQQQALQASQQAQTALRSVLETSESRTQTLEQQLQVREQELAATTAALDAANQRLADRADHIAQLLHGAVELRAVHEATQARLAETAARARHLTLQVDASREEDARLCDLLYAAQEKCELHEQELSRCQHDVRILTRANHVLTRQNDALAKDKHALAQQLARMRSANPSGRVPALSPGRAMSTSTGSVDRAAPAAPLLVPNDHDAEPRDDDQQGRSNVRATALGSAPDASFMWKQLQFASAKLQREQLASARLRERVAALEASERALTVRFREASAARKRVEQRDAHHKQQHTQSNAAQSA